MAVLRFSTNWNNKLTAFKAFTTIRLYNPNKYKIGETFEIFLTKGKEDHFMGYADIEDIKLFKLDQLSPYMSYLDTGYSVDECKKIIQTMYKNRVKDWSKQYLSFILLVKLNPKKSEKYNQPADREKQHC
jgi:uncharacterized protein YqfB (UPF0267 family)